jgi:multidrug efflux pump subunit AcrA (membrane-fusion protein)
MLEGNLVMKYSLLAAGLMTAALLVAPIVGSAQTAPYGANGYDNGQNHTNGVISSVNRGDLTLQDGRTIFLHSGTVINPTGTQLQPGMQVSVMGSSAGNGNFNAVEIDIANNGSNTGYGDRQFGGTISSVNRGDLTLQDGRTVFLHNGTVISPSGTQLQSGMRIWVTGASAGNGNVNANEVNVAYPNNNR